MSALALLAGSMCFTACSPKYTASFNQSKPFYEEKTLVAENQQEPITETVITETAPAAIVAPEAPSEKMVASTDKNVIRELAEIPSIKSLVEEHKANVEALKESQLDQKTLTKEIRKEEKRAHKAVKKQLVKEIKEISSVNDSEQTNAMNKKVFIGIVIAAAGIVIAILASGGLGAVAIIVGVGLIAWGIIEQGGV